MDINDTTKEITFSNELTIKIKNNLVSFPTLKWIHCNLLTFFWQFVCRIQPNIPGGVSWYPDHYKIEAYVIPYSIKNKIYHGIAKVKSYTIFVLANMKL